MRKNILSAITIFILTVLLICGCSGKSAGSSTGGTRFAALKEGDAYRDFTAALADGSSFTLSEHEGDVILLNFWATWCGPCVKELPAFTKLEENYGDKLTLLAVNCMEDEQTVQDFLSEKGYTFPVALDTSGEVSGKYPSDGIPYTVIIAPDGTAAHIQTGASGAEEMYQLYAGEIDKLLEKKPGT